jgi:hypothetical protein
VVIFKKASLEYQLKESKKDFINEIYYTTFIRAKLYVHILIIIYMGLAASYIPRFINIGFTLSVGRGISFYSYIMTLVIVITFLLVSKIKVPKSKEGISNYHKILLDMTIFLIFLTITVSAVGENIRANSIGLYIGTLFIISTLAIMTNWVSIFIYFFNMVLLLYFINISSILKLTLEMRLIQNISIILFTVIAWIFSRYFMYAKIEEYLKRREREELITSLEVALENIHTLNGMLPICSSCKNIRDDEGYWNKIENYVSKRSSVEFTHSICPSCAKKLYPEIYNDSNPKDDNSNNNLIRDE